MKDRLIEIRKNANITQEALAARLNLSRNFVWMLEKGERVPSDRTISDICREFDVNENWLRTGEGDMYIEKTRLQELTDFFAEVAIEDSDRTKLLSVLSRTSPAEWEVLTSFAKRLATEFRDEDKD